MGLAYYTYILILHTLMLSVDMVIQHQNDTKLLRCQDFKNLIREQNKMRMMEIKE